MIGGIEQADSEMSEHSLCRFVTDHDHATEQLIAEEKMSGEMTVESHKKCSIPAELADADLSSVVGGSSDQIALSQLISTVLKDLHDVRSSIIRNIAG